MSFQKSKDDIVVVSAARTPFGRFGGSMKDIDIYDLGAIAMKNVMERIGLAPELIDEVWWGCGDTTNCKDPYTPVVGIQVQVSVWAASNPDEDPGPLEEIRRQLSDRFDLLCYMGRPDSVDTVARILKENSHQSRRSNINKKYSGTKLDEYQEQIIHMAHQYKQIDMPDFLRSYIARLYLKHNLESIRAIEAIQQSALLHAVLHERNQVIINDVNKVIPLALKHRLTGDKWQYLMKNLDNKKGWDSILGFKNRSQAKDGVNDDDANSGHNARSPRNGYQGQLISSEKSLNF
jgi:magnesium chelatase subunit I